VDLIGIGVFRLLIPRKLLISKDPELPNFRHCQIGRTIFVRKYLTSEALREWIGIRIKSDTYARANGNANPLSHQKPLRKIGRWLALANLLSDAPTADPTLAPIYIVNRAVSCGCATVSL